jgi:UDPglucose 6-dehydrogenase
MPDYRVIVLKSTVPVGTTARLQKELSSLTDKPFDIVSNPEFMKEGYAVEDFLRPDRVVIGSENPQAVAVLEELYAPFVRNGKPIIVMDSTSSEMTKYAANAMLSTKISFINEIANLCESLGGDIDLVRRGICSDSRIGFQFLYPGLGFGGSCFPKDVTALVQMAKGTDYPAWLLNAVLEVNRYQKVSLQRKIKKYYDRLSGRTIAIWGLAFKPRTDDIRESPALGLIADLLAENVEIRVHDPKAMDNIRKVFGDRIEYCSNMYEALENADGLCLVTEWNEFRIPDYGKMLKFMKEPVIFDGRNVYDPEKMRSRGFVYFGIGRQ